MATEDRPSLPLPSHIHYELLLQLLERQTTQSVYKQIPQKEQLQVLIATLRKAFSQQKQLEESCKRAQIPVEYHWSLNADAGSKSINEPTPIKQPAPEPNPWAE